MTNPKKQDRRTFKRATNPRRWKITRRLGKWAESITFDGECVLVLQVAAVVNRAEDIVAALNRARVTLPRAKGRIS